MKKNIFYTLAILMVVSVFNSCVTPPIEAAQEAYDYNAIVPKIFSMSGPSQTAASGLAPVRYSVAIRGGSTTTFTVSGANATITPVEGDPFAVDILFEQSDVDLNAVVSCVETTMGGVSSEPFSKEVSLKKFKPMTFGQFLGEWSFVETTGGETVASGTITVVDGGGGQCKMLAVDGIPPLMSGLFSAWGETFQPGFGNEGNIFFVPNLNSGGVTIPGQYFGQTLPGPWDYWFDGSGNWEGINQTMSLSFGLHWDDTYSTNYNASEIVMTKL